MIGHALTGVLLAVGLVAITTLTISTLAGMAASIPPQLIVPGVTLAVLPGLVALGAAVFLRIYSGRGRPSWPFIFTAAGLLNVVIWSVFVAFFPADPPVDAVEGVKDYVDLVELFPYVNLAVSIVWAICGGIFSWLDARMAASEKLS